MFKMLVIAGLAVVFLVGCSATQIAGKGINKYCEQLTLQERESVRERVNAEIAPHSVLVTCYGDAGPELPPVEQ